ncbi:DUF4760 domain-containing protein [Plesiomonas shigelloides]|uniref:DUF4760 domain-containing protein n=1 Tax=Plesiomonas shigelloides TaxID=703 RepID=UPI00387EFCFD
MEQVASLSELISILVNTLKSIWDNNPTFYPGAIGALIAILSIKTQRQTSREKNSLDFEAAYKRNDQVNEAWAKVLEIYKNRLTTPVEHWGRPDLSQTDEAKALKTIFNEWERCANAIHHKIYDEKYLYKVYGSTLIFLDVQFDPYIQECRKKNPRFYRNMKLLALNWRVRRAYDDADNKDKNYAKLLKDAQKCIDRLNVTF